MGGSVHLIMVCVEGFEPPTTWFQAKDSTKLSYTQIDLQKYTEV